MMSFAILNITSHRRAFPAFLECRSYYGRLLTWTRSLESIDLASSVRLYLIPAIPTKFPQTLHCGAVTERPLSPSSMRDNTSTAVTHPDMSITASPTVVSILQRPTVVPPVGALPSDRPPTTIGAGPTGELSTSSSLLFAPQAYEHKHLQSLTSPATAPSTRLIDDGLFVYRQLWEHNDASHSMYVEPARGRKAHGYSGVKID
ncbi:hypothetical protein B0O80DRAFT_226506 [Mortierella sp. GBAus27b]|nr:hypothetical protein B0O80DRAFT_226506 [Mortierella sp. GBAus27b]